MCADGIFLARTWYCPCEVILDAARSERFLPTLDLRSLRNALPFNAAENQPQSSDGHDIGAALGLTQTSAPDYDMNVAEGVAALAKTHLRRQPASGAASLSQIPKNKISHLLLTENNLQNSKQVQ